MPTTYRVKQFSKVLLDLAMWVAATEAVNAAVFFAHQREIHKIKWNEITFVSVCVCVFGSVCTKNLFVFN